VLDHVSLGANDIAAAKAFYQAVLATVGLQIVDEAAGRFVDFGAAGPLEPEFSIETPTNGWPAGPGNGVHVAFRAATRAAVDAFHAAALAAGGTSDGAPGPRPLYGPHYYGAFVLDLEGNKIEAVCHAAP
jgi:catechol 2,3-dioxygenase-like lactoylglutathione lyase family enzyme